MKKILFIFREMGTGGAQKIEAFVANSMCDGNEVVAINMSNKPITIQLNPAVKIVNVFYDDIITENNKGKKILLKWKYLIKLRNTIKAISPDIVISFLSDVIRITVLAMKGMSIPIIGSERGDPTILSARQHKKYKKAYNNCKGVVFQLPAVMSFYNLPKKINQSVIPNPSTARIKSNWELNFSEEANVIVSAGRLERQKRFDVLIDAFSIIVKKYPEYRLIIFGEGSQRQELQNKIKVHHLENSIILFGDVKDVFSKENMKDVAFFVLSSDYEGIPNVILEAMMSGVPCIATDCSPGGARFLLDNGEIGLISPAGDFNKLANNMVKYIENPKLRKDMADKAKIKIKDYSPEIIRDKWIGFIEECCLEL